MSGLLPRHPAGGDERSDAPTAHLQVTRTEAEVQARWEVRAAQWRALELARSVFGPDVRASMLGLRSQGMLRGLLRLDVPFDGLEGHRRREAAFLARAGVDPLLSRVPLVYVLGPDGA